MQAVIASRSTLRVLKLARRLLDEVPDEAMADDPSWLDRRQMAVDDLDALITATVGRTM